AAFGFATTFAFGEALAFAAIFAGFLAALGAGFFAGLAFGALAFALDFAAGLLFPFAIGCSLFADAYGVPKLWPVVSMPAHANPSRRSAASTTVIRPNTQAEL
ncbi:MAG TPA: hypothetical protein VF678_06690, partial [bacterium]